MTWPPHKSAGAVAFSTPWFDVVVRPALDGRPYYMLALADYVSVVATTAERQLLLVRQYRPVVERDTVELPSGHVDPGETPEQAARRELLEETGFVAGTMEHLGTLVPDVGRLTNRMWCYFAGEVRPSAVAPAREAGVSLVTTTVPEALRLVLDGTMDHALNLSVLFLAVARGRLALDVPSSKEP
jgi:ADP-ribose pyrophosphatase